MTERGRILAVNTAISVRAQLAADVIENRLGAHAANAGPALAAQIDEVVRRDRLGYYPALEFFAEHPAVDRGFIAAVQQVGLFLCEYAKTEARRRLWPVFSQVRVVHVHLLALTLPPVRPQQPNAQLLLAKHYTPDAVRIDLMLASLERAREGVDKLAADKVRWWLREGFAQVEILDAREA